MSKVKQSLLQKQKLRSSWLKRAKKRIIFASYFTISVIFLAIGIFTYNHFIPKTKAFFYKSILSKQATDFRLIVVNESNSNIDLQNRIRVYVGERIKKNNELDIHKIAEATQKKFGLMSVNVYKTSYKELKITIQERKPIMVLEAEMNCLISSDLVVYRCNSELQTTDLPIIRGILLETKKWMNITDELPLSKLEKELLVEALAIKQEADKQKYEVSAVEYEPPRGFKVQLKNQPFSIFVGKYNYDKKFNRLSKLLTSQKKSLHDAEQIELDYQDKAIIQKKL